MFFLCPRLVEDWLVESRLAKVSIYLLVCVAMCCQTAQENAALKQYFFYKINQHALVLKNDLGGNSHDPPCARLKINGTVTSHKPGKRKKTDKDRCSWGPGLIIFQKCLCLSCTCIFSRKQAHGSAIHDQLTTCALEHDQKQHGAASFKKPQKYVSKFKTQNKSFFPQKMNCLTLPETGTLYSPGIPRKHQICPP